MELSEIYLENDSYYVCTTCGQQSHSSNSALLAEGVPARTNLLREQGCASFGSELSEVTRQSFINGQGA